MIKKAESCIPAMDEENYTEEVDVAIAVGPADYNRAIPKFTNSVTMSMSPSDGSVVLTFLYTEGGETASLIERIILNRDHVQKMYDKLGELLEMEETI